jgi:hypothetical protein
VTMSYTISMRGQGGDATWGCGRKPYIREIANSHVVLELSERQTCITIRNVSRCRGRGEGDGICERASRTSSGSRFSIDEGFHLFLSLRSRSISLPVRGVIRVSKVSECK